MLSSSSSSPPPNHGSRLVLVMLLLLSLVECLEAGASASGALGMLSERQRQSFWLAFGFPTPSLPALLYGNYCGPTPEVSLASKCRHPLNLVPIDKADEVCMLHDWSYCECEKRYYEAGKEPPIAALMAMRSAAPFFKEAVLQSVDTEYYKCIHKADLQLLTRYESLVEKGDLPLPSWDPLTRLKFGGFLEVFRRDMALDQAMLALPPDYGIGVSWNDPNSKK